MVNPALLIFGAIGGGVLFLAGSYYIVSHFQVFRLVAQTPTTRVGSLDSEGLVELTGTVSALEPLDNSISGHTDPVVSGWRVDDWDESGQGSGWKTVALGVDSATFELEDGTGSVRVDMPTATSGTITSDDKLLSMGGEGVYVDGCRAEFENFPVVEQIEPDKGPSQNVQRFMTSRPNVDRLSGSITNVVDIGKKHGERRIMEQTIGDGQQIYLLGHASVRNGATHPPKPEDIVIEAPPGAKTPFIVSTLPEEKLLSKVRGQLLVAGLVTTVGAGLLVAVVPSLI